MTFPTKQGDWELPDSKLGFWNISYPRIDLYVELYKAKAWLDANPKRQKLDSGMPRFLVNWLNKASTQQAVAAKVSYRPRATRQAVCPHAPPCASPGNWQCQQRTVLEQARGAR